ncbi:hypothetical protein SAY86_027126 [Trapa natans]|uniref:C2 domain-containing protein n=1 Tax=Trapa natans TaxID=22666 RepID=A0AAN7QIV4_TRANT|nr:hypothetical protein SAY86_027126 [Trapa natans]
MNGGVLEVFLVNARGIRRTNLLGRQDYYVVVECGGQKHNSKVSRGKGNKAWWNEKFRFELPLHQWRNSTHLKIRIMNVEFFKRGGGIVGDTTVYLGGVIMEGLDTGSVEVGPSSYNIILEDDTYKGELIIGFKFLVKLNSLERQPTNMQEAPMEVRVKEQGEEFKPTSSIWRAVMKLWKWKLSWWRLV